MRVALPALMLLCLGQSVYGQRDYSVDFYGKKIEAARVPSQVEKRIVRIGDMDIGERVQVYSNAMTIGDDGRCWINPKHIAFPMDGKGDLEVIRNKLGYIVHVNYKYTKLDSGYSVPRWSNWQRGYVPPNWIPAKAVQVDSPYYGEPSPSQKTSEEMRKPYNPRFVKPDMPPNPYSWETPNVRSNSVDRTGPSRSATGSRPGVHTNPGNATGNNSAGRTTPNAAAGPSPSPIPIP